MDHNIKIVLILTFGFSLAGLLGYLTQRVKLPSLLGFLIAGYIIGPHFPGYVADAKIAEQLAEIGIILMLFSVGLHFKPSNLFKVQKIAVPGAIVQTAIATLITVFLSRSIGWPLSSGIILGLAIGVASTFVLARVLADNNLLDTKEGHIAIGWLIVEDIFTVIILALVPLIAAYDPSSNMAAFRSIITVLAKFAFLCLFMFTLGYKAVRWILMKIAAAKSQELFTITVLAIVFLIATGSAVVFGTSLALGAFIAGMVIGKTNVKHQAAANALSLKDTFTIIFFLSIGMLLNPLAVADNFGLFLGVMGIILLAKPLAAFFLIIVLRFPIKTALVVSLALAQIGEFSFILAEQATLLNLLPDTGYDIIVICAFFSICLNPLFFKCLGPMERFLQKIPFLNRIQKNRSEFETRKDFTEKAIVIGYGPVGQDITKTLQELFYTPIVIEHNIDTVSEHAKNVQIIYGDASFQDLLKEAHVEKAKLLVITTLETDIIKQIAEFARELNPNITIFARIKYLNEEPLMNKLDIRCICSETESAKALKELLLSSEFKYKNFNKTFLRNR